MKTGLKQSKLAYYDQKSQYVLMNREGTLLETCHTLFRVPTLSPSLFESIPFLEGLQDLLTALQPSEELPFRCVQTTLLGREGYFDFIFRRHEADILWLIYDFTDHYEPLIPTQQERNNQAIEGEFMRIKQKATELEKQLLEYKNEELRRIQEVKTNFFSQVSHEMRTPINSIVGLVSLLTDRDSEAKHEYIEALKATSQHLATIVNDVLDLAKLEAGRITLETISFNLRDTVRNVMSSFQYVAQEKGIELSHSVDERLPSYMMGDPTRLAQVLYNLVGNAVKFTHEGGVRLVVRGQKKKIRPTQYTFSLPTPA